MMIFYNLLFSLKLIPIDQKEIIMIKLSVYIVTMNEEKRLPLVLDSIRDLADEIVVVDSGSTDRTEEIAHEYGARFIFNNFESIGHQVRYAEQLCNNKWVLRLDADEELSEGLITEIIDVKKYPEYDGYELRITDMYPGYQKGIRWAKHHKKINLYNRDKMEMSGQTGHDAVIFKEKNIKIKTLYHLTNHYCYLSLRKSLEKYNRATDLQVIRALEENKNYSPWRMVGASTLEFLKYYILGRHFLYGFWGFINCVNMGYLRFLKFAKYYEYIQLQKYTYPPRIKHKR